MARRSIRVSAVSAIVLLLSFRTVPFAQQSSETTGASAVVPRLMSFSGMLRDGKGLLFQGVVGLTFSLYKDQHGGAPLWTENQNVQLDEQGRYSVLLGATQSNGLPMDLFSSGESRWLGVQAQMPGEGEQPRILLVSVPYALKAADAETIGGKPASAFVLAQPDDLPNASLAKLKSESTVNLSNGTGTAAPLSGSGAAGTIAKWLDNNGTLGNSVITEQNDNVGVATTTPAVPLEVDGNNGELLRLNSTGNTMLSLLSSGSARKNRAMLLDQFGKFQIYNLTDGTSEFVIDGAHQVGVGTANPTAPLDIFSTGPAFAHVEGTSAGIDVGWLIRNDAPGGKQWAIRSTGDGRMVFRDDSLAAERVTLDANGNVGIGIASPAAKLDVNGTVKANSFAGDGSQLTNLPSGTATDVNCANPCISTGEIVSGAVTSAQIAPGTIVDANIAPLAGIQPQKIAGTAAILGGMNTFVATQTIASGNIALPTTNSANTGVLTLGGNPFLHSYGPGNTFVGSSAGNFTLRNVSPDPARSNTGIGAGALNGLTSGFENTAIGDGALEGNGGGWDNTATGFSALSSNSSIFNTATGAYALGSNTTGGLNTAIGEAALILNSTGSFNTASGFRALSFNTSGDNNTALGFLAGGTTGANVNMTGSNNTYIGYQAGPGTPTQLNNATAIGANSLVAADNTLVLGSSDVSVAIGAETAATKLQVVGDIRVGTNGTNGCIQGFGGAPIAGTCSSDARLKENIEPFAPVLDKVMQLQPVSYEWRADQYPEYHFGSERTSGLIAQEVEKVFPNMVATDERGYKAVNYSQLPLLLLEAMRELKAEKDAQQLQIRQLLSEVEAMKARLAAAGTR